MNITEYYLEITASNNQKKTLRYQGNEHVMITSSTCDADFILFPRHILEKFLEMIK